ncbi:hypothetical protein Poly21_48530 [Allorhodopirellula heiligendammensis]|uniref:Uncharacterized protein n=1 Tax=Allorhodopirellula heiligendammensis TaxID=2714739 RepID=A0A5C6BH16_9BACT|nr:hypothetical protein Poly21_48530 [Allorhodopirellula heiligendammensis]
MRSGWLNVNHGLFFLTGFIDEHPGLPSPPRPLKELGNGSATHPVALRTGNRHQKSRNQWQDIDGLAIERFPDQFVPLDPLIRCQDL